MNTLTIDIGNNKIKLDYWDNKGILHHSICDDFPLDEIRTEVENYDIQGIIVSSVRKDYHYILEGLKEKSGCELIVDFNRNEIEKYSDIILYKGNIGADRIAAFLGAQAQIEGPKLIIDAGTAITLDIVDHKGCFYGGNISLGLQSRLKALASATSMLPRIDNLESSSYFGQDTSAAIQDGAINGVAGELLYTVDLAKQEHGIEWVLLTGGDADTFWSVVSDKWNNCIRDNFLVGRGLNYHLRKYYFPDVFSHTNFQQSI